MRQHAREGRDKFEACKYMLELLLYGTGREAAFGLFGQRSVCICLLQECFPIKLQYCTREPDGFHCGSIFEQTCRVSL